MQILCLGDIAISTNLIRDWSPPANFSIDSNARILFNWELPIGISINHIPRTRGPRLLSHPESIRVIRSWGPGIAALATNHILDAGEEGLADTIDSLQRGGFSTVGAGFTREEITRPFIWETNEGKLAIINWVFPETHPDWERVPGPNCWPGEIEAKRTIGEVKREVDWVLIFLHWSDELFHYPRLEDRVIARGLADAGADLLIGHHPHVVRGMEAIGACPVFYSLGNYFFSDYPDSSGEWNAKWTPRNRESLGIQITFTKQIQPEVKVLSFWQQHDSVIVDPNQRAIRRMKSTSHPLRRYQEANYSRWYQSQRRIFNVLWYRLHYRLPRMRVKKILNIIKRRFGSISQ